MLVISAFLLANGGIPRDLAHRLALAITYTTFNAVFILMMYTGKTDRFRAALYVPLAPFFTISFMGRMIEQFHAHPAFVDFVFREKLPICPISLSMTLVPAALTRTFFWPGMLTGTYAAIVSMLVIWITGSLALGRGWCSWGCFFGGWDEGFSRVLSKPFFKAPAWLRDLPFASLLLFALLSAATLFPVYCVLFCPVKAVTDIPPEHFMKAAWMWRLHLVIFFAAVVALPVLVKRRAQCAYFCPLGALQCGVGCVSPFEVRIDTKACSGCGTCIRNCPLLAITEESLARGSCGIRCAKCGKCVDNCPSGAAHFHIKTTEPGAGKNIARLLFLYPAFFFMTAFGGSIWMDAISRIILLVFTGRMF